MKTEPIQFHLQCSSKRQEKTKVKTLPLSDLGPQIFFSKEIINLNIPKQRILTAMFNTVGTHPRDGNGGWGGWGGGRNYL